MRSNAFLLYPKVRKIRLGYRYTLKLIRNVYWIAATCVWTWTLTEIMLVLLKVWLKLRTVWTEACITSKTFHWIFNFSKDHLTRLQYLDCEKCCNFAWFVFPASYLLAPSLLSILKIPLCACSCCQWERRGRVHRGGPSSERNQCSEGGITGTNLLLFTPQQVKVSKSEEAARRKGA